MRVDDVDEPSDCLNTDAIEAYFTCFRKSEVFSGFQADLSPLAESVPCCCDESDVNDGEVDIENDDDVSSGIDVTDAAKMLTR